MTTAQEADRAYLKAQGRYTEAEAQVGIPDGVRSIAGKLETLTDYASNAVYFRIKVGSQELTAKVDDKVKLEKLALSILGIARQP